MSDDERVRPAAYRPPSGGGTRRRRWLRPLPLAGVALLVLLAGAAWFVFTVQAVTLRFQPAPDQISIRGGLSVPMGERVLLRPGTYTVVAEKAGYQRLSETIEVAAGADTRFAFELLPKPGRLKVTSSPSGATVDIGGETVGSTPLDPVTLAPGEHAVRISAQRHQVHTETVAIEGRDRLQTLEVDLVPAWAPVTVTSEPSGATLLVDGEPRGTTPVTAEIGAGDHRLALRLDGYAEWQRELAVVADQPQELETVQLSEAGGRLNLVSQPAGASVSVDDEYRGRTPMTVELRPDRAADVRLSRAGYEPATRSLTVASGATREWRAELSPILGEVAVRAEPADATLYVDGKARGQADQTLRLTATAHEIAIRKEGYVDYQTSVTPKRGLALTVDPRLQTHAEAREAAIPKRVETPAGGTLRLVRPGRFTMGAPRRQQGARANEVRREVELTRAFYIGTREVTNAQFRQFRAQHSSGIVGRRTLDNDDQPVVRVSWSDAVAYCNWLSEREGLPEAYRDGELVTPVNTGYRLPTEAEWAWAARFAGNRQLKYPWGDAMPPGDDAGNYADTSAADLLDTRLDSYDDGYAAAAPVGRFSASALGLYDIGGNVTEWVHDRYSGSPGAGGALETDPLGPDSGSGHVVRGASWRHGRITELRLSYRALAEGPRDDLGFRVARYAE